jgi:hypothetical protein
MIRTRGFFGLAFGSTLLCPAGQANADLVLRLAPESQGVASALSDIQTINASAFSPATAVPTSAVK